MCIFMSLNFRVIHGVQCAYNPRSILKAAAMMASPIISNAICCRYTVHLKNYQKGIKEVLSMATNHEVKPA